MNNVVSELRTRFDQGYISWAIQGDSVFRDYTDEESKMLDIFDDLSETVESISPDILRDAEELRTRLPKSYEEILDALLGYVGAKYVTGGYFEPKNAAEFVQKLIEYVRLRETNPSLFVQPNAPLPDAIS